jgi:excisionase family DNA binding protein
MADSPARRLYTISEAALLLGIGRSTAYELVWRGEIEAVTIGRRRLITAVVLGGAARRAAATAARGQAGPGARDRVVAGMHRYAR